MNSRRKVGVLAIVFWSFLGATIQLLGQQNGQQETPEFSPGHALPSPIARAVRTAEEIVIDGQFDEESWALAPVLSELLQRDPHEGEPATERTEIRILFDRLQLYLSVICYDSDPSGIVATELRRDADMEGDDIFELIFDTFHDHRNGYRFRVNPLGTQRDETINDEGRIRNANWDEKWEAKARITEAGWVAEIAIPFKAVRFAGGDEAQWGVNFHRTIMRKNEDVFWSGYNRGYTLTKVSGSGHLEGLTDIQGFRYRVKPYVTGGAFHAPGSGDADTSYRGKIGLEDVKYLLTPDLTLDFTVRPDFAQADVDQAQVNLSRFSLFFPEKREFFQEGSAVFQFGESGGFGGSDLLLFHSRRIGLSDDREEIPIMAGLKLTGTQGPLGVGLLNMQTNSHGDSPGQNFSVLRLKGNVLARSTIGMMLTRKTGSALGGDNRALGFDSNFTFYRFLNLQALVAKTYSNGLEDKDWSAQAKIDWSSDRFGFELQHLRIDENFRPEMGFVGRAEEGWKGLERTQSSANYAPRPDISWIRQFQISSSVDYIANREGFLDTREVEVGFGTEWESGDDLNVEYSSNFERLVEPFRIRGGGGTVPVGDYRFGEYMLRFNSYRGRRIGGNASFSHGGFFDGTITSLDVSPTFRPTPQLSFSPEFEYNRIVRDNNTFITREMNTEINYSLNQQWLTRANFDLNSQNKSLLLNLRLNYIFRPGDDLFVVYSESREYGENGGLQDRALIFKITYSLDR